MVINKNDEKAWVNFWKGLYPNAHVTAGIKKSDFSDDENLKACILFDGGLFIMAYKNDEMNTLGIGQLEASEREHFLDGNYVEPRSKYMHWSETPELIEAEWASMIAQAISSNGGIGIKSAKIKVQKMYNVTVHGAEFQLQPLCSVEDVTYAGSYVTLEEFWPVAYYTAKPNMNSFNAAGAGIPKAASERIIPLTSTQFEFVEGIEFDMMKLCPAFNEPREW